MFNEQIKDIHIGNFIKQAVFEKTIELTRICNFMECNEDEVQEMYTAEDLSTKVLLKWSKLLEYDFFRLYTYHLLLYTSNPIAKKNSKAIRSELPQFRKSMYSTEIIMFILEMIDNKEMTVDQIVAKYNIGRTTIYKWMAKYKRTEKKEYGF